MKGCQIFRKIAAQIQFNSPIRLVAGLIAMQLVASCRKAAIVVKLIDGLME